MIVNRLRSADLARDAGADRNPDAFPQNLTEAIDRLYIMNVEKVYRYHLARVGNVQVAQDLTSQTFFAAIEKYSTYQPEKGTQAAWVMGIAFRKLMDHFRRTQKEVEIEEMEQYAAREVNVEDEVARRLEIQLVSRALRRLSPDRAEALTLHFFGGLSLLEVASVTQKSKEAVKKLIHRGLSDLKKFLRSSGNGG